MGECIWSQVAVQSPVQVGRRDWRSPRQPERQPLVWQGGLCSCLTPGASAAPKPLRFRRSGSRSLGGWVPGQADGHGRADRAPLLMQKRRSSGRWVRLPSPGPTVRP